MAIVFLFLAMVLMIIFTIVVEKFAAASRRRARIRQNRSTNLRMEPTKATGDGRYVGTSQGPQVLPQPSKPRSKPSEPVSRLQANPDPILASAPPVKATAGPVAPQAAAASSVSARFIEPAAHKLNSKLTYATSAHGAPISSENRDEWLEARRWGVTATDVKKIVKLNGQPSVQRAGLLEKKLTGTPERDFAVFQHGRDREPIIAEWARQEFGVHHNQFLMCGQNSMHLATPDGIGEEFIVEIKTSVKEVLPTSRVYRDQLQWQLHVTDTERVLLIVENRYSLERETMWVHRNEERIRTLKTHADQFLDELYSMRT